MQQIEGSESTVCMRASCPENCADCNEMNECLECSENYEMSSVGLCLEAQDLLNSVNQNNRILTSVMINQTMGNETSNFGNNTGNETNGTKGNCTTILGCALCPGNGTVGCAECQPKFSKNPRGVCISCNVPNCKSCRVPNVCDQCN